MLWALRSDFHMYFSVYLQHVFVLQSFWMTWWLTHATSSAPCLTPWHPLYFWSSTALNEASRNRSRQAVRHYRRTHYSWHPKVWTLLVKLSLNVKSLKPLMVSCLSCYTCSESLSCASYQQPRLLSSIWNLSLTSRALTMEILRNLFGLISIWYYPVVCPAGKSRCRSCHVIHKRPDWRKTAALFSGIPLPSPTVKLEQ